MIRATSHRGASGREVLQYLQHLQHLSLKNFSASSSRLHLLDEEDLPLITRQAKSC